jgi:hypothetical protein
MIQEQTCWEVIVPVVNNIMPSEVRVVLFTGNNMTSSIVIDHNADPVFFYLSSDIRQWHHTPDADSITFRVVAIYHDFAEYEAIDLKAAKFFKQ